MGEPMPDESLVTSIHLSGVAAAIVGLTIPMTIIAAGVIGLRLRFKYHRGMLGLEDALISVGSVSGISRLGGGRGGGKGPGRYRWEDN